MGWKENLVVFPKLAASYAYDAWRFGQAAHLKSPFKNRRCAQAHLLRLSHSLEKGMALPEPRRGFGKDLTDKLTLDLGKYVELFGADDLSLSILEIVESTLAFHGLSQVSWPELSERASQLRKAHFKVSRSNEREVGTLELRKSEIEQAAPRNPESFFSLRRSVRQFADEPITRDEIERAVKLAQRSPSVCNRQGAKVYVYTEPEQRKKVLSFQDGNTGFGHQASAIFIVTCDMSVFYKNGERNQAFVDGGLFAMSLVFALHALGLGSCMLNWSRAPRQDVQLRKFAGIPDNEVVVTLLAAGRLMPKFRVAASPRRSVDDILLWRPSTDSYSVKG